MRSLAACLFLAFTTVLAGADDNKFESENKSQSVRPPVLAGGKPFAVPITIREADLDGQTVILAAEVKKLTDLQGKDVLVVGTVASTYIPKGNTKVILNFGKDFRNCFKAVIDDGDYKKWGTKDATAIAKLYDGKKIAVGGVVSLYQEKPQVLATLPHQLSVIGEK